MWNKMVAVFVCIAIMASPAFAASEPKLAITEGKAPAGYLFPVKLPSDLVQQYSVYADRAVKLNEPAKKVERERKQIDQVLRGRLPKEMSTIAGYTAQNFEFTFRGVQYWLLILSTKIEEGTGYGSLGFLLKRGGGDWIYVSDLPFDSETERVAPIFDFDSDGAPEIFVFQMMVPCQGGELITIHKILPGRKKLASLKVPGKGCN